MGDATPAELSPPSLRDMFAAHALTGIIASHTGADDIALPPEARAAKWAYEYADAMMRHRQTAMPGKPTDLEDGIAEAKNGRR